MCFEQQTMFVTSPMYLNQIFIMRPNKIFTICSNQRKLLKKLSANMNRKGQLRMAARTGQFKIDCEVRYRLSVELRSFQ